MISINLLPSEFRKEKPEAPWLGLGRGRLLQGAGMLFGAFTLVFFFQYHLLQGKGRELQTQWLALQGQLTRVQELQSQMEEGIRGEKVFLESHVSSPFLNTPLLTAVSVRIPDSLWTLELKVERSPEENTFLIKGVSAPFQQENSIQAIENYLQVLKEQFPASVEMSLTTTRQFRENEELTLFTAVFTWT